MSAFTDLPKPRWSTPWGGGVIAAVLATTVFFVVMVVGFGAIARAGAEAQREAPERPIVSGRLRVIEHMDLDVQGYSFEARLWLVSADGQLFLVAVGIKGEHVAVTRLASE